MMLSRRSLLMGAAALTAYQWLRPREADARFVMNQLTGFGVSGCPGNDYVANAVTFNGTNQSMNRGADLTGNADSKSGTASFWFRMNGGDGNYHRLYRSASGKFEITRLNTNRWQFNGRNAASDIILSMNSATLYTQSSAWHHIIASWDLSTGRGQLRVDRANDRMASPTLLNDTIDYTEAEHNIAAQGGFYFDGDIADLWIDLGTSTDIDDGAELNKFIDRCKKPIDLGSTGQTPTGSSPIMFFANAAASWQTNLGTGGGFTLANGPLVAAPDSPSD